MTIFTVAFQALDATPHFQDLAFFLALFSTIWPDTYNLGILAFFSPISGEQIWQSLSLLLFWPFSGVLAGYLKTFCKAST
jgi:hypothetical protein